MIKYTHKLAAAMTAGAIVASSGQAYAQTGGGTTSGNTFSTIAENITTSIQDLPGLLSGLSYMMGMLLAVLGVMKIKDHVENPSQTQLKDGAIRLAAGGALFALPIVFEAMFNTIGSGQAVEAATLNKVDFAVQ